jgi:prepilin-type N-terminal cleavage/methylation domain-containing protein
MRGFTLPEIVLVIILMGILSVVVLPRVAGQVVLNARTIATRAEMKELMNAIAGTTETGMQGFATHLGSPPANLGELCVQGARPAYSAATQKGWAGPYVETKDGDNSGTRDIFEDAWGRAYVYSQGVDTSGTRIIGGTTYATAVTTMTIYSYGPNGVDDSAAGDDLVEQLVIDHTH